MTRRVATDAEVAHAASHLDGWCSRSPCPGRGVSIPDVPAEPPPDGCPVHHLPREGELVVRDAAGSRPTTAGEFCDLWHDLAPVRAALHRQLADAARTLEQGGPDGHTVVPPAFRRGTSPNTLYPRVRERPQ